MGSTGKAVTDVVVAYGTNFASVPYNYMRKEQKRAKQTMKDQQAAAAKQVKDLKEQRYRSDQVRERAIFRARQKTLAAGVQGKASTILGGATDMATGGSSVSGAKTLLGV